MDKNKRVMKKVLATALSLSMVNGFLGISEEKNLASAWRLFGPSHSEEEIDLAYEKGFSLIDDGLELAKGLDDPNEAQDYIMEYQELKSNLDDDDKRTYDKAIDLQKRIKKLNNDIMAIINLQAIERRKAEEERAKQIEEQKLKAELEEKQKEEEHRRKLEEQKLQMEKEERERQEAVRNVIVSLEEKLDSILRDASKKIENPENVDHINARAVEIREKIQQIDNLNRVAGIEVLFEELQTEITNVLVEEDSIRQENLKRRLEEAKAGLFELRETLQNLLSDLDEENENYSELDSIFVSVHPELINLIDNLEGADAVKSELESAISKVKVLLEQQAQKEAEEKVKEELDRKIEDLRDPEKQTELLAEGKVSLDDIIGGNKKAKNKAKALIKSYKRYNSGGKIVPSKGLLFYGPPGTGKTSLAKAIAAEEGLELFAITPSFVMEDNGERKVLEMFVQAKKAAQISGESVIFLVDEIDAVAQKRSSTGSDKVLVMLMNEIDKLTPRENVIIFATTNRREALDAAIIRSGRLDQSVEVGHPNSEDKKEIMNIYLKYLNVADDVRENIDNIVDKMRGFSGADIRRVIDIAIESAMERENVEMFTDITITKADLQNGIATIMDEKTSVY